MSKPDSTDKSCNRFSIRDSVRYLQGTMSELEAEAFEQHAHQCPACLRKIAPAEDEYLLQAAMTRMDQLDTSVVTVIIKAAKDLFEFVSATAEAVFLAPALVPVRSYAASQPASEQPVVIQKSFADGMISAELTLTPPKDQRISVSLSLYNSSKETFMADIAVTFTADQQEYNTTTDSHGMALADLPSSDEITITFIGSDQVSGRFHVHLINAA